MTKVSKLWVVLALIFLAVGPFMFQAAASSSSYHGNTNGSIAANSSILTTAITPGARTGQIEVTVGLTSTNSVINVILEDNNGGTNRTFALNGGTALTAGVLYSFTFDVSHDYDYNFQPGTTTNVTLTAREMKNDR